MTMLKAWTTSSTIHQYGRQVRVHFQEIVLLSLQVRYQTHMAESRPLNTLTTELPGKLLLEFSPSCLPTRNEKTKAW